MGEGLNYRNQVEDTRKQESTYENSHCIPVFTFVQIGNSFCLSGNSEHRLCSDVNPIKLQIRHFVC